MSFEYILRNINLFNDTTVIGLIIVSGLLSASLWNLYKRQHILAALLFLFSLFCVYHLGWMALRSSGGGILTACKSNLKNLGTAMETYSTDWSGKYPTKLSQLTPNYLKTFPECPSQGRVTYQLQTGPSVAYNSQGFKDYYFLSCQGDNHFLVSLPPNYPQYDGIQGLIER